MKYSGCLEFISPNSATFSFVLDRNVSLGAVKIKTALTQKALCDCCQKKKKKKVPLEASLSQVQRMTPTGSSRAPLNTTNNGISLEAQQPRSSLTSQCLVFL